MNTGTTQDAQLRKIGMTQAALSKEQARVLINAAMQEAYDALNRAIVIANKNGLSFDFDVAYGMGGTYHSAENAKEGFWLDASSETC
jgi:hypothetical protein